VLLTQYCPGYKIEKSEMDRACSVDGEERGIHRGLVEKPEGRRPLGRPRRRWEDILRWIFRKWDVGLWTGISWLRIETGVGHL
jgi:hypothetical protein